VSSVGDIVEFLSDEFHKGKSYSSINTLKSSLSSILNTIDGFAVEKHPTVIRLLKGHNNSVALFENPLFSNHFRKLSIRQSVLSKGCNLS
jgi:hypothetical protein